jgi:MinD-like ATPase involved in chromosome partitioning or flagellar assembly
VSLTICDALVIVLRHDRRDYQGTGVTVDIVRQLKVPRVMLLVNEVPAAFDSAEIKTQLEKIYNCEVGGILPYAEEMVTLDSGEIFPQRYPTHPITATLADVANRLTISAS